MTLIKPAECSRCLPYSGLNIPWVAESCKPNERNLKQSPEIGLSVMLNFDVLMVAAGEKSASLVVKSLDGKSRMGKLIYSLPLSSCEKKIHI